MGSELDIAVFRNRDVSAYMWTIQAWTEDHIHIIIESTLIR